MNYFINIVLVFIVLKYCLCLIMSWMVYVEHAGFLSGDYGEYPGRPLPLFNQICLNTPFSVNWRTLKKMPLSMLRPPPFRGWGEGASIALYILVVNTWEKNPRHLVFLLFSISIVIHVILSKTIVLNIPIVQQTCPNIVHFFVVVHTKFLWHL